MLESISRFQGGIKEKSKPHNQTNTDNARIEVGIYYQRGKQKYDSSEAEIVNSTLILIERFINLIDFFPFIFLIDNQFKLTCQK
jgi:hypothetical protein